MRILHVLHDYLPRHRAGSELYAAALIAAQRARGQLPHVLAAEYDPGRPQGFLAWREHEGTPVTEIVNNWEFASFAETWRSPDLAARIEDVLDAVEPEVVHVHNLLNLSLELPRIAARRGIPSVATLHDWTWVCPSGGQRVHVAEAHVCHTIEPERCARCFGQSPFAAQMTLARAGGGGRLHRAARALGRRLPALLPLARRAAAAAAPAPGPSDIEARLAFARARFADLRRVVAPSRALAQGYIALGLPAERLEVADYGFPALQPAPREPGGGPLRLGFVGTLVWHKGAHLLLQALRALPGERFHLELFGDPETFPDYSAGLRAAARGLPVRFAGAFDRAGVAGVYARIDALVVPSLWPENSPLVIHEAFQCGVPVVAARLGGIPELVEDGVSGLLFDAASAPDLARAIGLLLADPALLERLRRRLPAVRSIDRDAARWDEIYAEVRA